jgi:uncharacterized Tic20 family protein/DNA-directed RNA polymerase subunit RPC12/RpoP
MPFNLRCPSCQARLKTPEALIGKQVKCPGCGHQILVQVAATSVAAAPVAPAPPKEISVAPPPVVPSLEIPEKPKAPPLQLDELEEVEDTEDDVVEAVEVEEVEEVEEVMEVEEEEKEDRQRSKKKKKDQSPGRRSSSTPEDRTTAMLVHLLGLFTGFIGPLILWLVKRQESRYLDHHGKEELNFQFTNIIVALVYCLLVFVVALLSPGGLLIMVPVGLVLVLYLYVLMIIAAVRAKQGAWYKYPGIIHFLK